MEEVGGIWILISDYKELFRIETSEQKKLKAFNAQKTKMCQEFFSTHPDMTDEEQIMVYSLRFRSDTLKGFENALKKIR